MKKLTLINAVIICSILAFVGMSGVLEAQTFKKKDAKVLYKVNSYNATTDNATQSIMMSQIENKQSDNIIIDEKINIINDFINSINELPDLTLQEESRFQKHQVHTDDPELQKIAVDPNTSLSQKLYYNNENNLVKIVFVMSHPIMRLTEEYYVFDDTKVYYKSDTYLGAIITDANNLQIDLYYPEYKKNIRKPIFLNEIINKIK